MKVTLQNNWVPTITNIDLNTATDSEIKLIGRMIPTELVIVIKGQNLSAKRQHEVCSIMGDLQIYSKSALKMRMAKDFMVYDGVARVTGAKNSEGKPGVFGQPTELDWHANGVESIKEKVNTVFLYAVEGTAGSRTSWLNNAMAYRELDVEMKQFVRSHKMFTQTPVAEFADNIKLHRNSHGQKFWTRRSKKPKPMYYYNEYGAEGMYYPHLFVDEIVGMSKDDQEEVKNFLTNHILQDKFMYDHDWEDGDIVISEQNLTQHKRWAFDKMEERLLWRSALDYRRSFDA